MNNEAFDFLRLSLVKGVGVVTAQKLIDAFGSVSEIWLQAPQSLKAQGFSDKLVQALRDPISLNQAKVIAQQCDDQDIQVICPEDGKWPKQYKACSDSPLILYVYGHIDCLNADKVLGMIGARKASAEGKLITRRWSSYVSKQGVVVVSGMAPGIDSAAHGGSLEADSSGIAVLGYGLKAGSPQQQIQINALADQGCVISEYPPYKEAHPSFFPQRNRLIAGLCHGLVVVEGGLKSGSMITARQALNYGREVFAVPGSVLNDVHTGCHQLIQDGAMLASDAEQIIQYMGWSSEEKIADQYQPKSDVEAKIIQLLSQEIKHVDALAEDCGLTVPMLSTILLALELGGIIERLPGSRYTLS